jgi:hydroxymethylglutaryl-CoA lyase
MSAQIEIVEVAPRDGLQNEPVRFATADKVALIERAIAAGLRRIEVTSFVHPGRVPQMADAEAVLDALAGRTDLRRSGLVMNRRGLDRAVRAGIDEINMVVVASETFSQRNQGASVAATVDGLAQIAPLAREAGLGVSVTIAAAFGCPFEGEIDPATIDALVGEVARHAPDEICLADTIGVASPADVMRRFTGAAAAAGGITLRAHFHNTRNTGLANAAAALQCGVRVLDSSLGGIGGCPFAPAATGNIPTEDLVYMLQRMGHVRGLALPALIEAAAWLEVRLGKPIPAMLGRAGLFPLA